jgi:hypothetical protein
MKRTWTFIPVTMHALQQMGRDRNACRARAVPRSQVSKSFSPLILYG